MRTCSRCGFHNIDTAERCVKCQALLTAGDEPIPEVRIRRDPTRHGAGIRRLWRRTTSGLVPTLPTDVPHRHPPTAAALSLIPGLGQIYNRQRLKALWIMLGWILLAALAAATFTRPISHLTLPLLLALWLVAATDAMSSAARINGQTWTSLMWLRGYVALLFLAAFVWGVAVMLLSPLVYFRLIGDDAFAPTIRRGDMIWLNKTATWFGRGPERGDLIYYDPEGFRMDRGRDTIFYNAGSYIERVIGLPGEHVTLEREGDQMRITVDGRPLDPSLQPLSTRYLPPRLEFDVPGDRWLILQSRTMNEGFVSAVGGAGASIAPSLAGADILDDDWHQSNLVARDQMLGRVFAISGPPDHRRWFSRGSVDTDGL